MAIGVYGKRSPSYAMNDSKTCYRSPHKGTASHRKNKYHLRNHPFLWCCSRWIHRDRKATERKFHETQVENYDFIMYLSRTTSHGIAVKWYLRVYWLLPLSIVDSFKKHRRFFFIAPSILLFRIDASFGKHRRLFWKAPWILGPVNQLHFPKESFPYFNGLFFSSSTESADSLAEVILNPQTLPTRPSFFLLTKRSYRTCWTRVFCWAVPKYVLVLLDNSINETESLLWLTPYKKGNDSGIYSTCHCPSH